MGGEGVLARTHEQPQEGDGHGEVLAVRTHVGYAVQLIAQDLPVPSPGDGGGRHPAPTMNGGACRVPPGLGELHRTTQLLGGETDQDLIVVDIELASESAAHLGCDAPDIGEGKPEVLGDPPCQGMSDLSGGVDREPAVADIPVRHHRTGLHRHGQQTLVHRLERDGDRVVPRLGVGDGLLGGGDAFLVSPGPAFPGQQDIGFHVLMDQGGVGSRFFEIDDRIERIVFHVDCVGRVTGTVAAVGHHHRHRLTQVVDLVAGQQRANLAHRHLGHQVA